MLLPSERSRTREFILTFGDWGTGKSDNLAQIADVYRATNTPGHFHIISTEHERWERTAEGYDNFDENCTIYETENWQTLVEVSEKVRPELTRDDWIAVDSFGNTQTWVRDEFFQKRFARTYRDWMSLGGSISDIKPADWNQMDGMHRAWFLPNIVQSPAHRYLVALQKVMQTEGAWQEKDKLIKQLFERLGLQPVGPNWLPAATHTVLWQANPSIDVFKARTIKEGSRDRGRLVDAPIELLSDAQKAIQDATGVGIAYGFVQCYLIGAGGWRMVDA